MRSWTVVVLLVIAVLAALALNYVLLYRVAYVLAFVLIIGYVWSWANIRWLEVERTTSTTRAQVGERLVERLTVRNTGPLPKPWVEVHDLSDLPGHQLSQAFSLLSGAHRAWRVETVCRQRGRFNLGPIVVRTSDPFGLFPRELTLGEPQTLVVYPQVVQLREFDLPGGELSGEVRTRRRTHQVTPVAAGVRDYQPGDSYNLIHWPTTARLGRLAVKEFELDPLSDVWVLLDLQAAVQAGLGPESTEEYGVTLAGSVAKALLDRNWSVGLIAFGQSHEVVPTDRGVRQLLKILETLAVVRALGRVPLAEQILTESARFGRNTTLVVITPSGSDAWVESLTLQVRRGVRPVAVLLDATSFGAYHSPLVALGALAAAGIPAYVVRRGDPLDLVFASRTAGDHTPAAQVSAPRLDGRPRLP